MSWPNYKLLRYKPRRTLAVMDRQGRITYHRVKRPQRQVMCAGNGPDNLEISLPILTLMHVSVRRVPSPRWFRHLVKALRTAHRAALYPDYLNGACALDTPAFRDT